MPSQALRRRLTPDFNDCAQDKVGSSMPDETSSCNPRAHGHAAVSSPTGFFGMFAHIGKLPGFKLVLRCVEPHSSVPNDDRVAIQFISALSLAMFCFDVLPFFLCGMVSPLARSLSLLETSLNDNIPHAVMGLLLLISFNCVRTGKFWTARILFGTFGVSVVFFLLLWIPCASYHCLYLRLMMLELPRCVLDEAVPATKSRRYLCRFVSAVCLAPHLYIIAFGSQRFMVARTGEETTQDREMEVQAMLIAIGNTVGLRFFNYKRTVLQSAESCRVAADAASHASDQMLAYVNHEIRNPLHCLIGSMDLVKMVLDPLQSAIGDAVQTETGIDRDDDSKLPVTLTRSELRQLVDLVSTSRHCGELMSTIVDDSLDMRKLASGKLQLDLGSVRIGDIMDLTIRLSRNHLSVRSAVTVGVDKASISRCYDVIMHTDAHRVKQMLMNLVSNAIKYTPEGAVTLSVKLMDTDVIFEIIDTGRGIPEDVSNEIFLPYTQARTSDMRVGTGLGLYLSRNLARWMGGDVTFRSNAPSVGTTFSLRLPLHLQSSRSGREQGDARTSTATTTTTAPAAVSEHVENVAVAVDKATRPMDTDADNGCSVGDDTHSHCGKDGVVPASEDQRAKQPKSKRRPLPLPIFPREVACPSLTCSPSGGPSQGLVRPRSTPRTQMWLKQHAANAMSTLTLSEPPLAAALATSRSNSESDSPSTPLTPQPVTPMNDPSLRMDIPPTFVAMVVDDVHINRKLLAVYLLSLGVTTIRQCGDGREALDRCTKPEKGEATPDIIFMDISMPIMDGLTATRHIINHYANLKSQSTQLSDGGGDGGDGGGPQIVGLTGNTNENDRTQCHEAGMVRVLSKPCRIDTVRQTLEELFGFSKSSNIDKDTIQTLIGTKNTIDE